MSAARSLRRLLSKAAQLTPARQFHSTPLAALPRNGPGNGKKVAVSPETRYTAEHLEQLEHYYTPSQLESILAGEAVVDPKDFARRQPRNGHDPYKLNYLSDLSKLDPILDFPKGEFKPAMGHPQQPLPIIEDPDLKFEEEDVQGLYRGEDLSRITGFSQAQLKKFTVRKMVFHRVVNQTRMGKIQRFYALHIAGNGNGLLGIGEGKSAEPGDAGQIATYMALRNLEPIPRYEGRTIYGNVKVKIGAVELELRTAPPGYGIRASEPIFEMCRCLGIQDLSAKITRSRNRMNVIKAALEGLRNQRLPDTIARGRGLKLADVRKVYYNGSNLGGPSSYL